MSVAFPFASVRDDTAGGAEQVLRLLDRRLTRRGWTSTVIACSGSEVCGTLVPLPSPPALIDDRWREQQWALCREAIERVAGSADAIHYHGLDFASYCIDVAPSLATLHLPLDHYSVFPRSVTYACVSQTQRGSRDFKVIPNGIEVESYTFRDRKDDFILTLGRICPEKGFHVALDAARAADVALLLAGSVHPYASHREYFAREILPRLDDRRRTVGAIGGEVKRDLFARARAVVIPSLIDETSSLVAMEALASGTPVIAMRRGALPEIVDDGVTGFLVSGVDEMTRAIAAVGALDPHACRAAAEMRFSAETMVTAYEAAYAKLA